MRLNPPSSRQLPSTKDPGLVLLLWPFLQSIWGLSGFADGDCPFSTSHQFYSGSRNQWGFIAVKQPITFVHFNTEYQSEDKFWGWENLLDFVTLKKTFLFSRAGTNVRVIRHKFCWWNTFIVWCETFCYLTEHSQKKNFLPRKNCIKSVLIFPDIAKWRFL